jgi:chromate reductase, NAD(P)H dehydrogenase (quinone)
MKLLAFTPALRKESTNRKLIAWAAELAAKQGAQVDLADFHDFDMPSYDGDLEEKNFPGGAVKLAERIKSADGLLISLPEYNFSIPGNFKNAVDWLSRVRPQPFRGKSALLLAASRGAIGGIRGLWQSRIPLEGLGVFVYPDMYTLAHSWEAFDENGKFRDEQNLSRLEKIVGEYLKAASALAAPR